MSVFLLKRNIKLKLKYILAVRNVFPLGKFLFTYLNLSVISRQAADKEMHQEVSENIHVYLFRFYQRDNVPVFVLQRVTTVSRP